MQTNQIESVKQTSDYLQLVPILAAMRANNDKLPKNAFPQDVEGTIQQNNSHLLPAVTLYNAHGILNKSNPNSLLGYA